MKIAGRGTVGIIALSGAGWEQKTSASVDETWA